MVPTQPEKSGKHFLKLNCDRHFEYSIREK